MFCFHQDCMLVRINNRLDLELVTMYLSIVFSQHECKLIWLDKIYVLSNHLRIDPVVKSGAAVGTLAMS